MSWTMSTRSLAAIMDAAPSATSAETRLPGTTHLVYRAVTIIGAIPRLRVPTNGYLFEISSTLYLDEYRKQRRQKRGGPDPRAPDDPLTPHPLERQRLGDSMDEADALDVVTLSESSGIR